MQKVNVTLTMETFEELRCCLRCCLREVACCMIAMQLQMDANDYLLPFLFAPFRHYWDLLSFCHLQPSWPLQESCPCQPAPALELHHCKWHQPSWQRGQEPAMLTAERSQSSSRKLPLVLSQEARWPPRHCGNIAYCRNGCGTPKEGLAGGLQVFLSRVHWRTP